MEATLTPMWTLGDRLTKSRKIAGISQQRMCELLGYAEVATLSRWENDKTVPRLGILHAWAGFTGVDVEWLLEGLDPEIRSRCFGPADREIPGQQALPWLCTAA